MANQEHVDVFKDGTNALLLWRQKHPAVQLDLSSVVLSGAHLFRAPLAGANLSQATLGGAHLAEARLTGANLARIDLSGADLTDADLANADLTEATLTGAHLGGANLAGACLRGANLSQAYLRKGHLGEADLRGADLKEIHLTEAYLSKALLADANLNGANLSEAYLAFADLKRATLNGSNLDRAHFLNANLVDARLINVKSQMVSFRRAALNGADFSRSELITADFAAANLTGTNLTGANLSFSDFSNATLNGSDFSRAYLQGNIFGNVDLSGAKGLDTVIHYGGSTIGINTIYLSKGNIPEVFLRGTGAADSFIIYIRSLVSAPIDYYTCFISYSSRDHAFAERLYADLQSKGVRCWFAPEDLKIGDHYLQRIEESIRLYDKLVLVLSEHAVQSAWVEREVAAAREKEDREQRPALFPVRLDEAVMHTTKAWAADVRRRWHIGDFTQWKQHDHYQKALERLLRDLRSESQQ